MPARGDVISFSIFIASTTQTTWPRLDLVAFADLDRENGALHGSDDRVARRAVVALLRVTVATPAGELGVRWLRREDLDLEATAFDLRLDPALADSSIRPCRYACCQMRQLLRVAPPAPSTR